MNLKVESTKFESMVKETFSAINDLQKDIMSKSNINEVISLIKNKTEIEDVNKALIQIHDELDTKCSLDRFSSAMDNQSIINDTLCSENCVGRWYWKTGNLKKGYMIPWESQIINTCTENFVWEMEKETILVIEPGLYEINMGFYADRRPTIQLLINGEPVVSAVNSSSSVIHHTGNKLKNLKGSNSASSGVIINGIIILIIYIGMTLIDFLTLPEKSRLSVSYAGEDRGEGFLSLRKL